MNLFTYLFVWQEGFNDKVAQLAHSVANLLILVYSLANPFLHLFESLLNANQAQFTTSLDELIGFNHKRLKNGKGKHVN